MPLPAFGRRRAAKRFARLLDARRDGRQLSDHDVADLDVVSRLERLTPEVPADPDFRDSLRIMLVAAAERDGAGAAAADDTAAAAAPAKRWARHQRAAILTGLAVTTAVSLPVASVIASKSSVPGQPLYGLKRSAESAELALQGSRRAKGQLLLEFAKARAVEASRVVGDAPDLAAILDDMDRQTREGVALLTASAVDRRDQAPLDTVDGFQAEQHRTMAEVVSDLTGTARDRAAASVRLLDGVKDRVDGLRGFLRCPGGSGGVAAADELGPLPRSCDRAATTSVAPDDPASAVPATPSDLATVVPARPSTPAPPAPSTVVAAPGPSQGPVVDEPSPTPSPEEPKVIDPSPDPLAPGEASVVIEPGAAVSSQAPVVDTVTQPLDAAVDVDVDVD